MSGFERIYCRIRTGVFFDRNGFKTEESRALQDFQSHDFAYCKTLAFAAYQSPAYQVRMYGVFLFGYLSEDEEILHFMKEEVTKDENWRVQEIFSEVL